MSISPGSFLRELRVQLQLAVRDVQKMSTEIASKQRDKRFYVSAARLTQIENDAAVPSQFKIFTLSVIYGLDYHEILRHYGVDPDSVHGYRAQLKLPTTRPVSAHLCSLEAKVHVPMRLDATFKWESTQLINRAVAVWGEIPAAFLLACNPREHMYAYIGLDDDTMNPLIRPGSLVMIDGSRRHVTAAGWANEHERPIYFIEFRGGYVCSWCQVEDSQITILPYPTSRASVRTFSLSTEAEVIGQVVSVAMRLVPPAPATQARDAISPVRF